jgi:1,4-alpha-glucan branching enzyme
LRRAQDGSYVIVILNFTPVERRGYRIGAPDSGKYCEIFNSNAGIYGGSNTGNGSGLEAEPTTWMGFPQSLVVTVPPLAGIIIKHNQ